jgi:hypothetical protein
MAALYYECHVTIEPVFDERRNSAAEVASRHGFKLAHLLMKKRAADAEARSDKDTFMTGHSCDVSSLLGRMRALVVELKGGGFAVWRYKIEECVIDSRVLDSELLLGGEAP